MFRHRSWPAVAQQAFSEAIRVYPFNPSLSRNIENADQARVEHAECIQNYILRETGELLSAEDIKERVVNAFPANEEEARAQTPTRFTVLSDISEKYQRDVDRPESTAIPFTQQTQTNTETAMISSSKNNPALLPAMPLHNNNSTSPSMSRRREASNRPTLKLHVELPPPNLNGPISRLLPSPSSSKGRSGTPTSTNITPSWFRLPGMSVKFDENASPITPADKRIMTPLAPPEIPRTFSVRRNAISNRWAPTPTEVVPPTLSYMPFDLSPTEILQSNYTSTPLQMPHSTIQDVSTQNHNFDTDNEQDLIRDSSDVEPSNSSRALRENLTALASPIVLDQRSNFFQC